MFWSILIGGIAGVFAWSSINDSRFRAGLARNGIITTAVLTDERCGRGSNPKFRITIGGRSQVQCAADDPVPADVRNQRAGALVTIGYDPKRLSQFVLAPGGQVPQRDIGKVWQDWRWRTMLILALYLPGVVAFTLIRRRKAKSRN